MAFIILSRLIDFFGVLERPAEEMARDHGGPIVMVRDGLEVALQPGQITRRHRLQRFDRTAFRRIRCDAGGYGGAVSLVPVIPPRLTA
jgi:hypothetical protein